MEEFFQQLTNGLAVGGIYALIALGYTMVYGVLKLINFAHGDMFTIGAYLGLTLLTSMELTKHIGTFTGALLLGVMIMILIGTLGIVLDRVAYRPLRESPRLSAVVSALGASIFLQNMVMLIYGARFQVYPEDSCVFFQRRDGCVMGFRKCRYCRFMWSYNEKEENSQGLCRYKNGGNLL